MKKTEEEIRRDEREKMRKKRPEMFYDDVFEAICEGKKEKERR